MKRSSRWRQLEKLEDRNLLAADLLVNEFLASNQNGIQDEDGDSSDWIELLNAGDESISLSEYSLTDSDSDLSQWRLPDISLAAGDTLLVFASGKDRGTANAELHTNFKLGGGGEFLALVEPDGQTIVSAYAPQFPAQTTDVSYGIARDGVTRGYFTSPTPNAPNGIAGSNPGQQVVINELMYHPSSEDSAEEFIELHNAGASAVDLAGWELKKGIKFTFPDVSIPAGGYLVVAADLEAVPAKYPALSNVVGPWTGKLSNNGETINLEDSTGALVDTLTYADEGDWSQRSLNESDQGTRGWIWLDDHDGGGRSLELVSPTMPNDLGQNWTASLTEQGTPGVVNSTVAANVAPFILDVSHSPAIPNSTDSVTVTARLLDEAVGASATLYWRTGNGSINTVAMQDDGQNGDLVASDGVLSGQIPSRSNGTVVEFYVSASDALGNDRTWPAPTDNEGQAANLLYQVDNDYANIDRVPGAAPIYFEVMTESERQTFEDIDRYSDAQMNTTLIVVSGTGTDVRYNAGVRIRGSGSRNDNPPNNRINLPSDRPLNGVTSLNINTRSVRNQIAGSALFRLAGLPAAEAKAVFLQSNGENLHNDDVYAHVEPLNSDFVTNQFPLDSNGNLYKGRRPNESPPGGEGAGLEYFGDDPLPYNSYVKQTNESEADWSDVIELTRVLNNTPDDEYLEAVEQVVDIDQWMRFFAMNVVINNTENGLVRGDSLGDDYAMYRGTVDTRFKMVPHDLDSLFSNSEDGIFRMTQVPALNRLITHPAILPRYYAQLRDLAENVVATPAAEVTLQQALQNVNSAEEIGELVEYLKTRAEYVLSEIPDTTLSVATALPIVGEFHRSSSNQVALTGTASSAAGSVSVNGEFAELTGRDRTWSIGTGTDGPSESLVPRGAVWSYLDDGSDQGTAWRNPDFVIDGSWRSGDAEFGYGDNDESTEISFGPSSADKYITTYFRHEFNVADVEGLASVKLGLLRDDGAAVYLNGVEVARDNLDDDADFDTRATDAVTGSEEDAFFEFSVDASLLVDGRNVLAVEVHQGLQQSSDLSFNLELEAFRQGDVTGLVLNPGLNRLAVSSFSGADGTGEVVDSTFIDIWHDDGTVEAVSGTLLAEPVVWSAVEGPYRVNGTLVIPEQGQLTIEPGTTVYFDADATLEARGILIAEGTADQRIRFTSVPNSPLVPNNPSGSNGLPDAPPHWDGIQFVDSRHAENIIAYADIEYAQDSDGAIGVNDSTALIDNVTFRGTHLRMVRGSNASMIVQNSVFPDMFAEDEIPTQLGLDNVSEHINVVGSIPADGQLIIRNNVFGTNKGHNDVIDLVSGRRPDPIAQVLNNVFLGSGDEELDLGGDVYVAGNLFMNVFKDDETSDRGYANAISTGDNGSDTTTVVARNTFWNIDHAINLKRDSATIFENNTVVGIHEDFNDRFDNPNVGSAINFYVDEPGATAGTGAYAAGNIFWDSPRVFGNADQIGTTTALQLNNNLLSSELAETTIGDRPGTITNLGTGNFVGDPRFVDSSLGELALRPGSEAIRTGWLAITMGATADSGIAIANHPTGTTHLRDVTLTVGGPGIFGYRYRVNGSSWSEDLPIGELGFVPNNTVRTANISLTGLPEGTQTVEVLGQDFAGEWQLEPTIATWTIQAGPQIVLSEVLASNTGVLQSAGATPDFIELQNVGGTTINLNGYSISDSASQPRKYTFESDTIVEPGEYLVVYADSRSSPGIHLGFGLSKAGEGVYLSAPIASGGALLDSVSFGPQVDNLSLSRTGTEGEWVLSNPTAGGANERQATGDPSTLKINEWLASSDTLGDFVELYNPDSLPVSITGLYLTDELGSAPTLHRLPPLSFVAANGYVELSSDRAENLSFKLSADQEVLALLDQQQNIMDVVVYYPQTTNVSQGRSPAGENTFEYFESPSPGRVNGAHALGDFDSDGALTKADLDLLYAEIGSNPNADEIIEFDLTGDQRLNDQDITNWVTQLVGTAMGDSNLDGVVGFADFLVLSTYFGRADAGWSLGDFNGDKEVGFADFLLLSTNFGFEK